MGSVLLWWFWHGDVQRLSSFEQRFEAGENHRPSLATAFKQVSWDGSRMRFRHSQTHQVFTGWFNVIGDNALRQFCLCPVDVPRHNQLPRWIALAYFAAHIHASVRLAQYPGRTLLPIGLDAT